MNFSILGVSFGYLNVKVSQDLILVVIAVIKEPQFVSSMLKLNNK